jgi:oxygen-independent coproporphyrinogen III oxidase
MVEAICSEIQLQKNYLDHEPIETIYFGGGTPSLLNDFEFEMIFKVIHQNFIVDPNAEITIEANPEDLTIDKVNSLKKMGANRLSIGIQSFDDRILKFLNRSHNSVQALKSMDLARSVGFQNISVDLIYAIPGRDSNSLRKEIVQLINLHPDHISAYSLTIEEKTVFGKWLGQNKFLATHEDVNAEQFEIIMDSLVDAGYMQYEISNYATPGYISKHNSNYWKQKKYLGVGPGAHSYSSKSRQANVSNNHAYLKSLGQQLIPAQKEILTRENQINEYLMTSVRTSWGCDLNYLLTNHRYDLASLQKDYINNCFESGLMVLNDQTITLTRKGKMLADKISSDLFLIP